MSKQTHRMYTRRDVEKQLIKNLNQMNQPGLLIDDQGSIIAINKPFLSYSHYDQQQVTSLHLSEFTKDVRSIEELERNYMNTALQTDFKLSWLDQEKEVHCDYILPIFIPHQEIFPAYALLQINYISTSIAISSLQTVFSDQIFKNSHLGLILLDHQAKIVKITKAAAAVLGGKRDTYINQNILQFFNHLPYDRQLVQSSLFEGVSVRNKAMSWNNGHIELELLIDSFPIFDQQNQLLGASVFIKDVTNVRSLENQIRRSDRLAMVGQIAAGTAHEIRNPLTSIKGFLQLLKMALDEHGMGREVEFTKIMMGEINRINDLVGEFLLLSKPKDTKYVKISLSELMRQFLPIVQNEALLQGIDVYHEEFSQLPMVMGDKELLKQVFLNICKNGIEVMGDQGKLSITYQLEKEEQMVMIHFHDSGPGIPNYVLDKIFEPFFTTKEEGTGLGLSVCQRIIHDMGGRIRVSSKGFGTTFHVQIPYIAE